MYSFLFSVAVCNLGMDLSCLHDNLKSYEPKVQKIFVCQRRGECEEKIFIDPD